MFVTFFVFKNIFVIFLDLDNNSVVRCPTSLTHSRGRGGVDADGVEGVGLTLLAKTSEEDHLSFSLEPRLPATSKDTLT